MRKQMHGPLAKSNNSPPPPLDYSPPPDNGLSILHLDGDMLVLSKPTGLLSVPGNKPHLKDCLESRVQYEFPSAKTVHRLDRATSGVTVMALNPNSHRRLGIQFEKRRTQKTYIAMVEGKVEGENGLIDQPLRTDWYNRPKQMVDACLGREAITHWKVLDQEADTTCMQLNPETGRSHQLRVHMQWLGHPIIGDEFYAPRQAALASDRLMLHANVLGLFHPRSNVWMEFTDPCPFLGGL